MFNPLEKEEVSRAAQPSSVDLLALFTNSHGVCPTSGPGRSEGDGCTLRGEAGLAGRSAILSACLEFSLEKR